MTHQMAQSCSHIILCEQADQLWVHPEFNATSRWTIWCWCISQLYSILAAALKTSHSTRTGWPLRWNASSSAGIAKSLRFHWQLFALMTCSKEYTSYTVRVVFLNLYNFFGSLSILTLQTMCNKFLYVINTCIWSFHWIIIALTV